MAKEIYWWRHVCRTLWLSVVYRIDITQPWHGNISLKPKEFSEEFHNTSTIREKCNRILYEPHASRIWKCSTLSNIFWVLLSVKWYWEAKRLAEGQERNMKWTIKNLQTANIFGFMISWINESYQIAIDRIYPHPFHYI